LEEETEKLSTEERNSLKKDYFTKGLNQKEIRNILMCRHNHIVSLVHLKRLGSEVRSLKSVNLSFIFFICIEMLAMSVANGVKFPFSIASPVSCSEFSTMT
jgi:hypothetical protein